MESYLSINDSQYFCEKLFQSILQTRMKIYETIRNSNNNKIRSRALNNATLNINALLIFQISRIHPNIFSSSNFPSPHPCPSIDLIREREEIRFSIGMKKKRERNLPPFSCAGIFWRMTPPLFIGGGRIKERFSYYLLIRFNLIR